MDYKDNASIIHLLQDKATGVFARLDEARSLAYKRAGVRDSTLIISQDSLPHDIHRSAVCQRAATPI